MIPTAENRVLGCLRGLAVGDAVGKQTENLSYGDVRRWYPNGLHGFEGAPGTPIPRYLTNKRRQWVFGETTDDTERTLAVARAVIADGAVSHATVGQQLLTCQKSVHPGLPSLWEFHEIGDPTRLASGHDGCGAAIRVSPVGLLYRPDRLSELVDGARQASISTHAGPRALAAAAAVAAAVSAAVDGYEGPRIIELASAAATEAERQHPNAEPGHFVQAMERTLAAVNAPPECNAVHLAATCFPNHTLAIVPLGLALAVSTRSARVAILVATNTGGDSDSVASISGAVAGAMNPGSVPVEWVADVESINLHDLEPIAAALLALRR